MRRKVIQIANSTQLISLPRKWAKEQGIKKGDELNLLVQNNSLVINPDLKKEPKRMDIDLSDLDRNSILHIIRGLYRKGFDEINISFKNPVTKYIRTGEEVRIISVIHHEVNHLTGVEIVKQSGNLCTIKCISEVSGNEFPLILRRIFLLLVDTYKDFITAVKTNDKILLKSIEEKHTTITKFSSYCIRLLNKKGHEDIANIPFLHHVIATLDKITDLLKYCMRDLLTYDITLGKKSTQILESIGNSFVLYHNFYYNFKINFIRELSQNRDTVKTDIKKIAKDIHPQELSLLNHLSQSLELLLDITEARISIQY